METLGIDLKLLVAQIINFALLLFLLQRFLYKPILKILAERKKKIAESLENAEKIKKELEKIEGRKQAELKKAQVEGERILDEVRLAAKRIQEEAAQKAAEQAQNFFSKARQEATQEREEWRQKLKEEFANLVVAAAQKIIAEKLTPDKNEKFIREVLQEFKHEKKLKN